MLKTLQIENFRRFKNLSFPTLKRVNLIAGKNNTGKTGVLESIVILLSGGNNVLNLPELFRTSGEASRSEEDFWKWQFHNYQFEKPIIVKSEIDPFGPVASALTLNSKVEGFQHSMSAGGITISKKADASNIGYLNWPLKEFQVVCLPSRPTDPGKDALNYDRVALKIGAEERLDKLLRIVEPRYISIRSLKPHGSPLLYVDLGLKQRIPAIHLGQGFIRLLSIYSELIISEGQVLLIDEIENGLHYSILIDIWRGLLNLAESENVQIFATTHSYECILAAHRAFAETLDYDFALHRMDEVNGEIKVTTYDKESLETSFASHWEVR